MNAILLKESMHILVWVIKDQIIFRLNEINKIKDYFNWEIQESKIMSNNLSKCIAAFDYFDKTLIV